LAVFFNSRCSSTCLDSYSLVADSDYIELNVKDIARSRDFYGKAFAWTFTEFGPEYCEFQDGRLKGGLTTTAPVKSGGGPLVILYADDLAATQKRVEKAGGNIVKPIYEFPGGHRFHFKDPDGYELAVWSADKK
jgi:predicted enzyme related to lactoylglutathione lyase